jgi:hypothetical protein
MITPTLVHELAMATHRERQANIERTLRRRVYRVRHWPRQSRPRVEG